MELLVQMNNQNLIDNPQLYMQNATDSIIINRQQMDPPTSTVPVIFVKEHSGSEFTKLIGGNTEFQQRFGRLLKK